MSEKARRLSNALLRANNRWRLFRPKSLELLRTDIRSCLSRASDLTEGLKVEGFAIADLSKGERVVSAEERIAADERTHIIQQVEMFAVMVKERAPRGQLLGYMNRLIARLTEGRE